jgi:hypothetical protein
MATSPPSGDTAGFIGVAHPRFLFRVVGVHPGDAGEGTEAWVSRDRLHHRPGAEADAETK